MPAMFWDILCKSTIEAIFLEKKESAAMLR
jgi:hypothetical protein